MLVKYKKHTNVVVILIASYIYNIIGYKINTYYNMSKE